MELLQSKQYANIKQYVLTALHTIKYWKSPTAQEYYFDSPNDWNLAVPTFTNLTSANAGTKVYTGVTSSSITISNIATFNPLSVLNRNTTKPLTFNATNQVLARTVNFDYKDNTQWGASFENLGANNTINIRFYTNVGLTAYYNVAIALPVANTRYKAAFNPFIVGTYGQLGTPVTLGGNLTNTAQAVVTIVGGATGTNIVAISESTNGTITTGITPIYLEAVNNSTQLIGTKLSISLCCLKEFVEEVVKEYTELECKGDVSGKVLNKQSLNVNFTVQKNIELLVALGLGTDIIERTLNITGTKSVLPISNGVNVTAQLGGTVSATNLAFITVDSGNDCFTLQRDYINNTSATLDKNFYYVNPSTGQIVLSTALSTFTEITAYPITSQLVRTMDYYTELNPIKAILEVQRQAVDGTQITGGLFTLELSAGSMSSDDAGDTTEFQNTALITGYNQSIRYTY